MKALMGSSFISVAGTPGACLESCHWIRINSPARRSLSLTDWKVQKVFFHSLAPLVTDLRQFYSEPEDIPG